MHSIVLFIVIPLITVGILPLLSVLRPKCRKLPWLVAFWLSVIMFIVAVVVLFTQQGLWNSESTIITIGNWHNSVGIALSMNNITNIMIALIMFCSLVALYNDHNRGTLKHLTDNRLTFFYTTWLIYISSLIGICLTADTFNLFVFLELSTLCTCALLSQGSDSKSYLIAYRYLLLGITGGVFYLFGIGILYAMTGTFNFAIVTNRLYELSVINEQLVYIIFILIFLGLMIKSAVFPLYFWLPQAYVHSPFNFTTMMASIGTKINLYALYKILYEMKLQVLLTAYLRDSYVLWAVLWILICGVVLMSIVAYYQEDIRAALGFSSIASMSLIFMGLIYDTSTAHAALFYLMAHALAVLGFMTVLGDFWSVYKSSITVNQFQGLFNYHAGRVFLLSMWILLLLGLPGSGMFTAKWIFLESLLSHIIDFMHGNIVDGFTHYFWFNVCVIFALLFSSFMILLSLGKFIYLSFLYQHKPTHMSNFNVSKICLSMILLLLGLQMLIFMHTLDVRNLMTDSITNINRTKQEFVKPKTMDMSNDSFMDQYLV